jgi:hypothetical protein
MDWPRIRVEQRKGLRRTEMLRIRAYGMEKLEKRAPQAKEWSRIRTEL